jgi:hypothetical protein
MVLMSAERPYFAANLLQLLDSFAIVRQQFLIAMDQIDLGIPSMSEETAAFRERLQAFDASLDDFAENVTKDGVDQVRAEILAIHRQSQDLIDRALASPPRPNSA